MVGDSRKRIGSTEAGTPRAAPPGPRAWRSSGPRAALLFRGRPKIVLVQVCADTPGGGFNRGLQLLLANQA